MKLTETINHHWLRRASCGSVNSFRYSSFDRSELSLLRVGTWQSIAIQKSADNRIPMDRAAARRPGTGTGVEGMPWSACERIEPLVGTFLASHCGCRMIRSPRIGKRERNHLAMYVGTFRGERMSLLVPVMGV